MEEQEKYKQYELEKRCLPLGLTPQEYEARIREISRRLGI